MTPPKKPDWIELADNDGGSNNLAPIAKKSHPLIVAMAALTLTFGGAVVAQTYQGGSRGSEQPSLAQTSQSAASSTSANLVKPVQSPSIKAPSNGKSTVPAIAIPPNIKGGDDEDDDEMRMIMRMKMMTKTKTKKKTKKKTIVTSTKASKVSECIAK